MPRTAIIAAIVAMLALASPAFAQGGIIASQLADAARAANYTPIGKLHVGELKDNERTILDFDVEPGKTYKLFGACDQTCNSLGLRANDAGGDVIEFTRETTDAPSIHLSGFPGRTISVAVSMLECDENPCVFGVTLAEAMTADGLGESEKVRLLNTYSIRVADDRKRVGDLIFGRLRDGESATFDMELDARTSYQALADCGQLCYNIDLTVMNAAGAQIGADTAGDAIPLVEIAPDGTGRRRLKFQVKMTSCDRPACVFVLGLYRSD